MNSGSSESNTVIMNGENSTGESNTVTTNGENSTGESNTVTMNRENPKPANQTVRFQDEQAMYYQGQIWETRRGSNCTNGTVHLQASYGWSGVSGGLQQDVFQDIILRTSPIHMKRSSVCKAKPRSQSKKLKSSLPC